MGRPKGSKNKTKNVTRTLMEIAQDLVTYSNSVAGTTNVELELTVPQLVLDAYTGAYTPAEVVGATLVDANGAVVKYNAIGSLHLHGGTVTLTSTESTNASEQVA